jgi:hypothetical protein
MAGKRMRKRSQGESKRDAVRRRRLAEPRTGFLFARCSPDVETETARHLAALRKHIDFRRVPQQHPLRDLWASATSGARFQVHHLADDLLALEAVDGFAALLKRMLEDAEAYEDYRYELRMAASLARADGQTVVRLAGNRPGADVEFLTRSAARCALACYRARSATPGLNAVSAECASVARGFLNTFAREVVPADVGIEVLYPSFPITADDSRQAKALLDQMWRSPGEAEHTNASGILVRRCVRLRSLEHSDRKRRARIRFMFRVAERERLRIDRHLRQKLVKEDASWASSFDGCVLVAVEESGFSNGLSEEELAALMSTSAANFSGIISTQLMHTTFGNVTHGFEDVTVHLNAPIELGVCTYGQNSHAWSKEYPAVSLYPDHACEFWDLWQDAVGVHAHCSRPLEWTKRLKRLDDRVSSVRELKERPEIIEHLAQAAVDMRDDAEVFDW